MRAVEEAERAEKTKAETDQLLKEFTELKAQQTERGIVLTMGDVLFAFGKSALLPGAIRNVQKVADFLQKNPTRNILIEGYTDSVGSDEFNLTLSQKRADAVKEQLVAMGIRSDRITTKGYGKQFPVASNESEGGRQLNRRVEVLILNEGVSPETVFRK
jgi:outer membrane protein OmpA-like peptidoglycan-associated protein